MSRGTAREAGVEPDGGFGVLVDTANGTRHARIAAAAPAERSGRSRAATSPSHISRVEGDDLNVIGMNFLSTLSAWGVEGRTLVLEIVTQVVEGSSESDPLPSHSLYFT